MILGAESSAADGRGPGARRPAEEDEGPGPFERFLDRLLLFRLRDWLPICVLIAAIAIAINAGDAMFAGERADHDVADLAPEREPASRYVDIGGVPRLDLGFTQDVETLRAPSLGYALVPLVPSGWTPHNDGEGNTYYYHAETGASSWDHPSDPYFRTLLRRCRNLKVSALRGHQGSQAAMKANEELNGQLDKLRHKYTELKDAASKVSAENDELSRHAATLEAELTAQREEHEAEVSGLKALHVDLRGQLAGLRAQRLVGHAVVDLSAVAVATRDTAEHRRKGELGEIGVRKQRLQAIHLGREHLVELRSRLIKASFAVLLVLLCLLPFSRKLYNLLATPMLATLPEGSSMIAIDVASPFLAPFKLALLLSLITAMPIVLYQLWAFVAPALFRHEKRLAKPLLFSSVFLFYLGCAFAYFVVFPLIFDFFAKMTPEGVALTPDIGSYMSFALSLFFAFGIAFEVPVAIVLLTKMGVISASGIAKQRPYFILGAFVIGMLMTPPDPFSQIMLAVPVCVLFEIGLFFARKIEKNSLSSKHDEV